MADKEKVIKGLECCVTMPDIYPRCEECPYADAEGTCANMSGLHRDALALLRTQDKEMQYRTAKKVEHKATLYRCCTCPSCGNVVGSFEQWGDRQVRITVEFCMFCGQRLDWSDELMGGR